VIRLLVGGDRARQLLAAAVASRLLPPVGIALAHNALVIMGERELGCGIGDGAGQRRSRQRRRLAGQPNGSRCSRIEWPNLRFLVGRSVGLA
jgi:hypothetical protein